MSIFKETNIERELNEFYAKRHFGNDSPLTLLEKLNYNHTDEFLADVMPKGIQRKTPLNIPEHLSEYGLEKELESLAQKNKIYKSYIGLGYYETILPPVIARNVFENPGWYTAYTPYQAEISQGRLEALFHFQTMITEMTQMDVANASLLDEASASCEAMLLTYKTRAIQTNHKFFVSSHVFESTIDVLQTRAEALGIEIEVGDENEVSWNENEFFGAILQVPGRDGEIPIDSYKDFCVQAKRNDVKVVCITDLLALALISPPGEWRNNDEYLVDVVCGTTQRLGMPMGFGGPHAAYFATRKEFQRLLPGRLVGISYDSKGRLSYRLTLQTREQHIRKEKATSNVCTAQALPAIVSTMYAIYHGPEGLTQIAYRIHLLTSLLQKELQKQGFLFKVEENFFDTICILLRQEQIKQLKEKMEDKHINIRYEDSYIGISLNETTSLEDIKELIEIFSDFAIKQGTPATKSDAWNSFHIQDSFTHLKEMRQIHFDKSFLRNSLVLKSEVFHLYHSETRLMRYLKSLEDKDIALNRSMIPLGSCTMKLNAVSTLQFLSHKNFKNLHPFAPRSQWKGYEIIIEELSKFLADITGLPHVSFQPNSGAQGELTALLALRRYYKSKKQNRNVVLIPSSAHGTNSASAVLAGMEVRTVSCTKQGNIDIEDLENKCKLYKDKLACLMLTYPSTSGVFEEEILKITKTIHDNEAQVYMDGANMNAQMGLINPAEIGVDFCHLNLHKTFAIPHGGGGPGMGPICVAEHLKEFLPTHRSILEPSMKSTAVTSAPFSSALLLCISYAFIRLLGRQGIRNASIHALLNANYMKQKLQEKYSILYTNRNDLVAHEMIVDFRPFMSFGITVEDVAKRLIDYGFHAPTMSWPTPGTLMIEPTESEDIKEIDRFCEAMFCIYDEICDVQNKIVPLDKSPLKTAPHTTEDIIEETIQLSKEVNASNTSIKEKIRKLAYPLRNQENFKYWPPVSRIDNAYGDRNLMCTCSDWLDNIQESQSSQEHNDTNEKNTNKDKEDKEDIPKENPHIASLS